jgi:hypothetical protein
MREAINSTSHTLKNRESAAYGQFLRMMESTIQMVLEMRYTTHGVIAVEATNGLIIMTVAITNPAVLAH